MRVLFSVVTSLVMASAQGAPSTPALGKQLWLFGGGEPICSSIEPESCDPAKRDAADAYFTQTLALRGKLLRCDEQSYQALQQIPAWPSGEAGRAAVLGALQTLNRLPRTFSQLQRELPQLRGLDDEEQSLIEDACEIRLTDKHEQSLNYQVYWPGMHSDARQLFEGFIAQAHERKVQRQGEAARSAKPRLLLLTSSSYNPFEWVEYYRQVFRYAGADVDWLPLEPALSRGSCQQLAPNRFLYNGQLRRAERYPELAAYQLRLCQQPQQLLALVDAADAVFINGGDQSLTMRSLTDPQGQWTPLAKRLLDRVEHEGIPLAGSSAGTAIQGGRAKNAAGNAGLVMVSSGQSSHGLRYGAQALDIDAPLCRASASCRYSTSPTGSLPYVPDAALTYNPDMGLRLMDLAVTDTHFRERNREGRLLRLLHDSQSAAGVGVDEATVLRVDFLPPSVSNSETARLSVLGRGSVWWLDASQARGALPTQDVLKPEQAAVSGHWAGLLVARLSPGDTLQVQRTAEGQYHYQGTLGCKASAQPANAVDANAYNTWQDAALTLQFQLNQHKPIQACTDTTGRWHYLPTPLDITLTLGALHANR